MKQIPLTRGLVALVDDGDYEWLSQWKWRAIRTNDYDYAARQKCFGRGKTELILMHRLLVGCTKGDGVLVDHRNHDTLDNQKHNLRKCTTSQNTMNRRRRPAGVHWNKKAKRWTAYIKVDYQQHHLGYFNSRDDAVAARRAAELHHFGEFAPEPKV